MSGTESSSARRFNSVSFAAVAGFSILLIGCAGALAGEPVSQRDISFDADGFRVVGTLVEPAMSGRHPIVLILHGMGGRRHGPRVRGTGGTLFGEIARDWAARGVASLRISTGGRGGSAGEFVDMTLERRTREAVAAIRWIARQPQFDSGRITLLGHSQGSLIAAAAGKRLRNTVTPAASVVLWAPQANALDTYRRSMGFATYEKGIHAKPGEVVRWRGIGRQARAFRRNFFTGLSDFDAVADIRAYGGPVLIVTGRRDRWAPGWKARAFSKSGAPVTFKSFDVGHRMGADRGIDAVREVSKATLDWLLRHE